MTAGKKPPGHTAPDVPGDVTWEWQLDAATLDAIVAGGTNPYDQSSPTAAENGTARRRTLDDIRLLSEEIKRSKKRRD